MRDLSGDSHKELSKKQRILKVIDSSEMELTPRQIATMAGVKHSTTRDYLRQLLKQGKIVQPYPSSYCSHITHSMIVAPLRTHNILLTAGAPWLAFSDDTTEYTGEVKVRIQYGLQRRKITGRISCDAGMDRHSVMFALNRFYDLVKQKTGHDLDTVTVKTFELNRDKEGVRLDGAKCYTRKGLFGIIERIYQKDSNTVRMEQKISTPMTVDKFTALLRGGVTTYNITQGLYALVQEIRILTTAQKFMNRELIELKRRKQQADDKTRTTNNFII